MKNEKLKTGYLLLSYHLLLYVTSLVFIIVIIVNETSGANHGLMMKIVIGIFVLVLGTFSFLLLPIVAVMLASGTKFLSVLAFPAWLILLLDSHLGGHYLIIDDYDLWVSFSVSCILSLWGLFNIWSARYVAKRSILLGISDDKEDDEIIFFLLAPASLGVEPLEKE